MEIVPTQVCTLCKSEKPLTEEFWYKRSAFKGRDIKRTGQFLKRCRKCMRNTANTRYASEPKVRDRARVHNNNNRHKIKTKVLEYYSKGTPKCECCAITFIEFLAIDHINGGGNKHRKEIGIVSGKAFYYWLVRNKYPKGFRVLCHNCNMSIGHFGYCPHNNS